MPRTLDAASKHEPGEDLLGDLEVEANPDRVHELPPFRIELRTAGEGAIAEQIHDTLRSDLLAFGRFIILDPGTAGTNRPDGWVTADVEPFGDEQYVITGTAMTGAREVAIEPRVVAGPKGAALGAHRLADHVVEAFTGRPSTFSAPLAIVRIEESTRRAYLIDVDGGNERLVSKREAVVSAVAFGPRGNLVYAASLDHGEFSLHGPGAPVRLQPRGSVYGLAWSADGSKTAVSIADGQAIRIWTGGPDFTHLEPLGDVEIGLQPTFSPDGRLAWAGTKKDRRRVYVGKRAVSPTGVDAFSPAFCAHADGPKLVWVEQVGRGSRLVVADADGKNRRELDTRDATVGSPTCSADGRMVAFIVQEGRRLPPGLYMANLDRWRPRKMTDQRGDGLRWSPKRR